MWLESSASSSVEASVSFVSSRANAWQNCSECGGISKDGSELLSACNMCVKSGPNLLSKRRKVHRNSVIVFPGQQDTGEVVKGPLETWIEHQSSVLIPPVITKACVSDSGGVDHSQRLRDDPCLEVKCSLNSGVDSKYQIVGSNKELCSDNIPSTKPEMEVVDEDLSIREMCFSFLKSYLSNSAGEVCLVRRSACAEDLRTCIERSVESCKLCGNSDDTQNMLLCDNCDEAFHASCCNPKIKILPIDNWFCFRCSKFNDATSQENSLKSPGIGDWRNGISRFEKSPIALMLKYPEPYKSRVRIGQAFQADVPDWPNPISSDADSIGEPLQLESTKIVPSVVRTKFPKFSNWLQCQEILYNDTRECTEGTVCGKWRRSLSFRAPFSAIQTDNWDCSCAVLWDPTYSDCAAPQECDTDEVLRHLAFVEQLRADIAARRKKN
ncbi:uncharacterized protein LOC123194690 isoform X3 [Mangifera indica]|nr:uncharacterized protein LOC123194690 isoform X3 [Mangifera indica]XP_044463979.1 uncharacterized protein LOC123194690 isoform X3 [Mangifera indica]XP_044463980.1 uncharacterized protein LOC123194690 isoform X3 [Mangifera indica]